MNAIERMEVDILNLILTDTRLPGIGEHPEIQVIDVTQRRISNCTGCFGCWTKTPGICVINDDARSICDQVARCERLMVVSRLTLGCYALPMKRMLERLLPNQQPFIRIRAGETHHVQRYDRPTRLDVVVYGGVDAGEEELFKRWLARNVLNMAVRDYGVAFARTADEACQLAQKVVSEWAN